MFLAHVSSSAFADSCVTPVPAVTTAATVPLCPQQRWLGAVEEAEGGGAGGVTSALRVSTRT